MYRIISSGMIFVAIAAMLSSSGSLIVSNVWADDIAGDDDDDFLPGTNDARFPVNA